MRFKRRPGSFPALVFPGQRQLQIRGRRQKVFSIDGGCELVAIFGVVATESGSAAIQPAYFDAFNARTGLLSRFSSDRLTVAVRARSDTRPGHAFLALALAALIVILAKGGRRRTPGPIAVEVLPSPAPVAFQSCVRDAIASLRARNTREGLCHLRDLLRHHACAGAGDTASDILARTEIESELRSAIARIEEAVFCENVSAAHLAGLLVLVERYAGTRAAAG